MSFEDVPIKRKLTAVIMFVCCAVLVLTCSAFLIYELVTFRKAMVKNLSILTQVIADNSTATLIFRGEEDAAEILSALKAEPHIVHAALYDEHGVLFARYPRTERGEVFPVFPGADGPHFEKGHMEFFQPVQTEKRLGTVFVRSDMLALSARARLYTFIVLLVLATSLVIAFALSTAMQRRISDPVLALAAIARTISRDRDYTVRAQARGRDELGQLTEAFNHMLTQIHERDLALSEKEERLRLALEASKTGTWDWNIQTNSLQWSGDTLSLFGIREDEFDGTYDHLLRIVHSEDREMLRATTARAIAQRSGFAVEFRVIWPDQSVHFLSSRGRAFYDDAGQAVRLSGACLDVTESKQAEMALRESEERYRRLSAELESRVQVRTAELAEINEELEAFTYSVSHDLRAPLRHINAYAQVLEQDSAQPVSLETRKYLRRIGASARNMGQLVDDLLNLAHVGKQGLTEVQTPLRALVEEAAASLKLETAGRAIQWKIGQLPWANCDSGLVKQVFVNLLSNAVKYTRLRDSAVIEIGQIDGNGEPVIFVRDNGVGFDMRYADKLFGVFQRLHRAEEFEGTGVGLATVHRIIQKHRGRIWADAEVGKGATFYFTFPGLKPN